MSNNVMCSLIYDGKKMHLIDNPFPTLEMIEAVVGEQKPEGHTISDWMFCNNFKVFDNLDLNTVNALNGWSVDFDG